MLKGYKYPVLILGRTHSAPNPSLKALRNSQTRIASRKSRHVASRIARERCAKGAVGGMGINIIQKTNKTIIAHFKLYKTHKLGQTHSAPNPTLKENNIVILNLFIYLYQRY